MTANDDLAQKIAAILQDAVPAPATPSPSPLPSVQQINHGPQAIQVAGNLTIQASPYITPAQAYELHQLIKRAVALEAEPGANRRQLFAKWYAALKKKFRAPSYKFIPAPQADAALAWMRQHIARLRRRHHSPHHPPDRSSNPPTS